MVNNTTAATLPKLCLMAVCVFCPLQAAFNPVPGPRRAAVNPVPGSWTAAFNPVPGPWQAAVNPVPGPWQAAVNPVPGPSQAAVNPVPGPSQAPVNPVPGPWQAAVNPVPGRSQEAVNPVPGPWQAAVNPVLGSQQAPVNPVPGPWLSAVNPVPGRSQAAVNPVPGLWQAGVDPVPGLWQAAVNPVPGRSQAAVNPIPGLWQAAVNPVPGIWQAAVNPVPGPPPPPEAVWLPFIQQHYPSRMQQTYFSPPLHFNHTFYTVEDFEGEDISVMQEPQHHQVPHQPRIRRHRCRHQPRPQTYSQGRLFTPTPPGLQPSRHQETNVQDDQAQHHTLQCLKVLSDNMKEVMMVISQLRFRKYLDRDNCTSPVDVATVARLPNWQSLPAQLAEGECDVLVIHREQGLIVGEIKSTGGGDFFSRQPESQQNQMIVNMVEKAVKQMNNKEMALRRLVSDLNITITRVLICPNLISAQLLRGLANTPVAQVNVSLSVALCTLFHQ